MLHTLGALDLTSATRRPFDFGGTCLIGQCDFDAELVAPGGDRLGLHKDGSFLYGTWRDEAGNLLRAIRGLGRASTDFRFLFVAEPGEHLRRAEAAELDLWLGPVGTVVDGGVVRVTSASPSFRFVHEPAGVTWIDGAAIDVAGSLLGPAVQWFNTWEGGACYSASAKYHSSGMFLGRPVEGFVGHEIHYFSPGANWLDSPYGRGREICWQQVANLYEDGTVVHGTLACGTEGWGFAMLHDEEGRFVATTDVEVEATVRPSGYPATVTYRFADQSWTWRLDPQGERPQIVPGSPMFGADGTCTRDGDGRPVRLSMGNSDWWGDGRAAHIVRA